MITSATSNSTGSPVRSDSVTYRPFAWGRRDDDAVKACDILIVDDEPVVAAIVRKHLKDAGFEKISMLHEGNKLLDRMTEQRPDVVLLDIHLGAVNGLELLDQIRRTERFEHTPVLMVTQADDDATRLTALNLGANDFLTKPVSVGELVARVRNTLSAKVYRDRVLEYSMQLKSDVLRDALTGIANRRAFDYELKRRMSEWRRQKTPLGLLMIDIDHFKSLNDRFGHTTGDAALRHVAGLLQSSLRDMDLVARYGGEEFAVILPATDAQGCIDAVQQLQNDFSNNLLESVGQELPVTVSVGVAVVTNADDAELLLRRADTALYAAKQNGRNCSYLHNGSGCVALDSHNNAADARPRRLPSEGDTRSAKDALIAIVDDEPATVALTRKYLKDDGFQQFESITDSTTAIESFRAERPDLILLDLHMPQVDGFEVLRQVRRDNRTKETPVIVLTASRDKDAKVQALKLGASDFLEKPIQPRELLARVHNTLLAKAHVDMLKDYSSRLEYEVQARTTELMASRREAVQCLARAAELRDDVTGRHVIRVGRYAAIIAEELGFSAERINWMEHAAQLHDVGKIGIPDAILHKPGRLTEEEFSIMQGHCVAGRSIIRDELVGDEMVKHRNVFDDWTSPMMHLASVVAATHHEKWDGTGYPRGLQGTDIPIEGRITAIADVFDALSTTRPYKAAIPLDECFCLMEEKRGTHFDPDVLDAFFRRRAEVIQTAHDYADRRDVR
ncbi:MAG: hypothetical protein Fues2KO_29930 [Fuerstiella sp.]